MTKVTKLKPRLTRLDDQNKRRLATIAELLTYAEDVGDVWRSMAALIYMFCDTDDDPARADRRQLLREAISSLDQAAIRNAVSALKRLGSSDARVRVVMVWQWCREFSLFPRDSQQPTEDWAQEQAKRALGEHFYHWGEHGSPEARRAAADLVMCYVENTPHSRPKLRVEDAVEQLAKAMGAPSTYGTLKNLLTKLRGTDPQLVSPTR